ncbi:MAG: RNA-binding domain-containing protein [Candidatus Nanoarchaeia archaeon]
MNKEELVKKLEDIEWEDFEVKEAVSEIPKSTWETVSAFSNTAGGWLVFGVRKTGMRYEILGVKTPDKIEQDFFNTIRAENKFNKKIDVTSKKYKFEDKIILAFYIPPKSAREKPVYFNSKNNTFIRTGSGDQRATNEEIDTMFRAASFEEKDKEITKYTIKELDEDSIRRYRTYFATMNPGHRYIGLSDDEFLEKLGLILNNKVTYGGLLLFGTEDCLSKAIPQYKIDYIEIPGTSYETAPTRYSFRLSLEKNLFLSFFDLYEQLTKKIAIDFSVKEGFREDDPAHVQAIREALVNLIIHTDYFSQSSARIRIFTDRIEFYNPGALPKKIEFILKEDYSQPRNPSIAKAFRFIKLAEGIGSGFHKMINGWQSKYNEKPIIAGDFDHYKITFPTTTTTTKTITKTTSKNREKMILEIIQNNPHLTAEEISKQVGITVEGIRYHIKNLTKKNLIKRVGGSKKGHWEVK